MGLLLRRAITLIVILFSSLNLRAQNKDVSQQFSSQVLNNPKKHSSDIEKAFRSQEVILFEKQKGTALLTNGYARSQIQNPQEWKQIISTPDFLTVNQIDIIFTKYPKDKSFWITDYHHLLSNRLKELFTIDPSLNDKNIQWNLVLQTACNTEPEAKQLFHGIQIHYEIEKAIKEEPAVNKPSTPVSAIDSSAIKRHITKIDRFVKANGYNGDSVVFKVLNRHIEWKETIIVLDWTGSMYPYGGQALSWHTLNFTKSGIKQFVFFNDGDNKKQKQKKLGATGGIYFQSAADINKVYLMFNKIKKKGKGGDEPENDIEALLSATKKFPQVKEVVLIADNSCIRDYRFIDSLKIPVKVILCGYYKELNPQYLNLAYKTKGSFHTIDQDIDFSTNNVERVLTIRGLDYALSDYDLYEAKDEKAFQEFYDCSQYYEKNYYRYLKRKIPISKRLQTTALNLLPRKN